MDAYSLPVLFSHRDMLEALRAASSPTTLALTPRSPGCRSVALLPGSFNPPTAAHALLADRALREGFDCVGFVSSVTVAGKEPSGLIPEDRLLALRMVASGPRMGVFATSAALYPDQAAAASALFGDADITFLVGSDKVEQIFDRSWYPDGEAALERLFERARLLVAPRADDGRRLGEILDAPHNRRYAHRVSVIQLHPAVSDLSSTRVRGLLQAGADPSGLVPGPVAALLTEVRAFHPPVRVGDEEVDLYRARTLLIEALARVRGWAEEAADLRSLISLALDPREDGSAFRRTLFEGTLDRASLAVGADAEPFR